MVIILEILSNMVRSNFSLLRTQNHIKQEGVKVKHICRHSLTMFLLVFGHSPVEILKRFNENRKLAEVETWNLNHGAKFIFPDTVNEASKNNSKIS